MIFSCRVERGLITDCAMTMAAGPGSTDAENGVELAARDRFRGEPAGPAPGQEQDAGLEVYGDSAYGSGEARDAYRQAGHDTVIKSPLLTFAVARLADAEEEKISALLRQAVS
jgi:hypothetical protein